MNQKLSISATDFVYSKEVNCSFNMYNRLAVFTHTHISHDFHICISHCAAHIFHKFISANDLPDFS